MTAPTTTAIEAATDTAIDRAADHLRAGRLVAFPTETVYGLGADATSGAAVARIFAAKDRPRFNPLIVHVADIAGADRLAAFEPAARQLAEHFWPGPLTLVMPARAGHGIADLATAGLATIAIRQPAHPVARALIRRAGVPIAAPSANRSGHVSATTAAHVSADLQDRVAMILDGGATVHGLESTIAAVVGGRVLILRPGAVTRAAIEAVLGRPVDATGETAARAPSAPGMLASHYAPRARVRLNAIAVEPGEALLAFGPAPPPTSGPVFNLSPAGDLIEAAAALFAGLRQLDTTGVATIAAMAIPDIGLGDAINDRLRRAAAAR